MGKIREKIRALIPRDRLFPLILAVSFNMVVYTGSRMIAGGWRHYNIEGPMDQMIPFWPPSAVIYLGCYLFWAANYILIARQEKKEVCQFFAADLLSRAVCLVFFSGVSHDKCPSGGRFRWDLESDDAFDLQGRCSGQSLSVDSLPGELVLLHRTAWEKGNPGLVSGSFVYHGASGVRFDADDKAACNSGCDRRDSSGGNLFFYREKARSLEEV